MDHPATTIIFDWAGVFCTPGEPFSHPIFSQTTGLGPDDVGAQVLDIQDAYYRGKISPKQFWRDIVDFFGLKNVSQEELSRAYLDSYRLFPEMLALAARLKTNYRTVLLSNLTEEMMHAIEERHAASAHFQKAIFSNQVGFVKPETEIFRIVLEAAHANPAETIFIDDSLKNVAAAAALGLTPVLFTSPEDCLRQLNDLGIRTD